MIRPEAKEILSDYAVKERDVKKKEALCKAVESIEQMEKMRDDTERLKRDLSQRIAMFRQSLQKEISEQMKIPSWSYVRALKFASDYVDKHLTRIEGLMQEGTHEEDRS